MTILKRLFYLTGPTLAVIGVGVVQFHFLWHWLKPQRVPLVGILLLTLSVWLVSVALGSFFVEILYPKICKICSDRWDKACRLYPGIIPVQDEDED